MDYYKHYNILIERARNRPRPDGYVERHHVIPKCMGGDNEAFNIVFLTAPEHYVSHLLLVCMNPGNRVLALAAIGMATGCSKKNKGRSANKMYGWLKSELAKGRFTEETRKKMSESAKNKKLSPEHRAKISAAQKGIPKGPASEIAKVRMSAAQKGRKLSPEHCEKMRVFMIGRKMPPVTDQWRARQRAAKCGKKISEEHKTALSWKGRKHSEETKEKMRQKSLGRKLDSESKTWIYKKTG